MPAANGRFATTANGSSGSGTAVASPCDDLDLGIAAEAGLELSQRCRVELERAHAGARGGERAGQCAAAGAEVEHERARRDAGIADELVCESATTKSVATARPRLR